MARATPSYKGLEPSSKLASRVHARSSAKAGTKCEKVLWAELRRRGLMFTKNVRALPGTPDVVFRDARVVVFCDGDFWHGRRWQARKAKLKRGTNATYWIAKIESNMRRDRRRTRELRRMGWATLRLWETDILRAPERAALRVQSAVGPQQQRVINRHG